MRSPAALWLGLSLSCLLQLAACGGGDDPADVSSQPGGTGGETTATAGSGGTASGAGGMTGGAGGVTSGTGGATGASGGVAAGAGGTTGGGAFTGGAPSTGGAAATGGSMGGTGGATGPTIGDVDAQGRTLVWAQEFDGRSIDRSVWGNEMGLVRNDESQYYSDYDRNQFIEDGELVIRAIAESDPGGGTFTSASLTTEGSQNFSYGRIEGRMKVPGGTGCWPAFWLLPSNKDKYAAEPPNYSWWPLGGEIDIMEYVSQDDYTVYGTAHYQQGGAHEGDGSNTNLANPVADDYHVFAIDWTPTSIDWSVDGLYFHHFDSTGPFDGMYPFQDPMYLIVNLAVDGSWAETANPAEYPQDFRIDYIRYWAAP